MGRQPVKGRKKGGGVRFGEMERDSLLSHGATFLLQDRLFHGSDKSKCAICKDCGSFLSARIQAGGALSDRDSLGLSVSFVVAETVFRTLRSPSSSFTWLRNLSLLI